MNNIVIYTQRWCPYCVRAKAILEQKGVSFQEITVDGNPDARKIMAKKAGQTSVPQIWIGEQHIGGYDQLHSLDQGGKLDSLLDPQF